MQDESEKLFSMGQRVAELLAQAVLKSMDLKIAAQQNKPTIEDECQQRMAEYVTQKKGIARMAIVEEHLASSLQNALVSQKPPIDFIKMKSDVNQVTFFIKPQDYNKVQQLYNAIQNADLAFESYRTDDKLLAEARETFKTDKNHVYVLEDPDLCDTIRGKFAQNNCIVGNGTLDIIIGENSLLYSENGYDMTRAELDLSLLASKTALSDSPEKSPFSNEEKLAYREARTLQAQYDKACLKKFIQEAKAGKSVVLASKNTMQGNYLSAVDGQIFFNKWEKGGYQSSTPLNTTTPVLLPNGQMTEKELKDTELAAVLSSYTDEIYSEVLMDSQTFKSLTGKSEHDIKTNPWLQETLENGIIEIEGFKDKKRPPLPEICQKMEETSRKVETILHHINKEATDAVQVKDKYESKLQVELAKEKKDEIMDELKSIIKSTAPVSISIDGAEVILNDKEIAMLKEVLANFEDNNSKLYSTVERKTAESIEKLKEYQADKGHEYTVRKARGKFNDAVTELSYFDANLPNNRLKIILRNCFPGKDSNTIEKLAEAVQKHGDFNPDKIFTDKDYAVGFYTQFAKEINIDRNNFTFAIEVTMDTPKGKQAREICLGDLKDEKKRLQTEVEKAKKDLQDAKNGIQRENEPDLSKNMDTMEK